MVRPRTFFLSLILFFLALPSAQAQEPLAQQTLRTGRAMWLEQQTAGVWISPRRMWLPTPGTMPLSACGPRGGCAPVVGNETCTVPACPGSGTVVIVGSDVANVSEFPRDYGGYTAEIAALRADPGLSAISGYLGDHPDHARQLEAQRLHEEAVQRDRNRREASVRWVSQYRDKDRLELALSAELSVLTTGGGVFAGGTASAAYIFLQNSSEADDDGEDDTFLNIMLGDQAGAELRVHFMYSADGAQSGEWMTLVGVGGAFANRLDTSVVRLPSFLGAVLPEFGLALRADHAPTWYVGWNFPVSLLLTHDVAMDAGLRVFVVDDWFPEVTNADGTTDDPAELIVSFSVGIRLP